MNNTERIICETRAYATDQQTHSHDYGQMLFPLHGELSIQTGTQSAIMNERQLIFIPPGCKHIFAARAGQSECLVVDIPQVLAPPAPVADGIGLIVDLNPDWRALRSLILSETGKKAPSVQHLLHYSFHLLQEDREPLSLQYLHAHFCEPISIAALAELEHFNVSYYSQWFRQRMGLPPQQYLRQLRLQEAKRLLTETDYSLAYIAQAVGYSQQSHLTRLFQQSEHITPLAYRSHSRGKKC